MGFAQRRLEQVAASANQRLEVSSGFPCKERLLEEREYHRRPAFACENLNRLIAFII